MDFLVIIFVILIMGEITFIIASAFPSNKQDFFMRILFTFHRLWIDFMVFVIIIYILKNILA